MPSRERLAKEANFEVGFRLMLRETGDYVTDLVNAGYDLKTIPVSAWDYIERQARDKIAPAVYESVATSSALTLTKLGLTPSESYLAAMVHKDASNLTREITNRTINKIRSDAAKKITKRQQQAGIAAYLLLLNYFDEIYEDDAWIESRAITANTFATTAGQRAAGQYARRFGDPSQSVLGRPGNLVTVDRETGNLVTTSRRPSREEDDFDEDSDEDFDEYSDEDFEPDSDTDSDDSDIFDDSRKAVIDEIWVTARDEKVCAICEPLDGTSGIVWGQDFPMGPPAHPNCRCELDIQYRLSD